MLDNKEYAKILALSAKFAGVMDISGTNLFNLRKKVAAAIEISPEKLDRMITPIEKVYAIVDHTRCLAYMLGDCIVPSNVREGYLARLGYTADIAVDERPENEGLPCRPY